MTELNAEQGVSNAPRNSTELVEISFYTDPICCWSWALEKPLSKVREFLAGRVEVRYVIYAMITDWQDFHDPLNSVSTPAQMGPVWMHASAISGVPMADRIWHLDPPTSSVPSALAVKCAGLQSRKAEETFLDAARQAVMIRGLNISRPQVLIDVAKEVEEANPDVFSADKFERQFHGPLPLAALKKDMDEAVANRIGRFPTLIIKSRGNRSVIVTGYRPYEVLLDAIRAAKPNDNSV